jgi:hypothetical protein
MDDEFEKAQRQWKKLVEKADSAKKAYHLACRNEKSAYIQLMNLRGDASTANENADKTRERHEKCRETVIKFLCITTNLNLFRLQKLAKYMSRLCVKCVNLIQFTLRI